MPDAGLRPLCRCHPPRPEAGQRHGGAPGRQVDHPNVAPEHAGTQPGAEKLLKAVETGKASARLLQEQGVVQKLNESKLPKAGERIAALTKGLPSADQKLAERQSISWRTVERAADKLAVRKAKDGFDGGTWAWSLPAKH